jgi:hypothetical protein
MAQAEMLQRAPMSLDVSDPKLYQDDTWRPLFARLRRGDPVHYCGASPFGPYWSIARYDDILAVELDQRTSRRVRTWAVYRSPISRRGRSGRASSGWTRRGTPRSGARSRRS